MAEPPRIEVASLTSHDADARAAAIRRLGAACVDPGFFTLENTGIPESLVAEVYAMSRRFHTHPDTAAKQRMLDEVVVAGRGWVPLHSEPAYEPGTTSFCESFDLGRELPPEPPRAEYGNLGPNTWPDFIPGFRDVVSAFYRSAIDLGRRLAAGLTEALDLPGGALGSVCSERSPSLMRLLHYPANDGPNDAGNVGISAHSDFEAFTLMHQDAPGLQLLDRRGRWVEPAGGVGRFTVILGDMLEVITNGELPATRHRVGNDRWERSSLILFCAFDGDEVIRPLPPYVGPTRPARRSTTTQLANINREMTAAVANLGDSGP